MEGHLGGGENMMLGKGPRENVGLGGTQSAAPFFCAEGRKTNIMTDKEKGH